MSKKSKTLHIFIHYNLRASRRLTADELIVVGSSDDGVTGKHYPVLQIVQHPDYGTNKLDYEYSCVQVEGKFYYWAKRALLLPSSEPADNAVMKVAGYGYTVSLFLSLLEILAGGSKPTIQCNLKIYCTSLRN